MFPAKPTTSASRVATWEFISSFSDSNGKSTQDGSTAAQQDPSAIIASKWARALDRVQAAIPHCCWTSLSTQSSSITICHPPADASAQCCPWEYALASHHCQCAQDSKEALPCPMAHRQALCQQCQAHSWEVEPGLPRCLKRMPGRRHRRGTIFYGGQG